MLAKIGNFFNISTALVLRVVSSKYQNQKNSFFGGVFEIRPLARIRRADFWQFTSSSALIFKAVLF